MTNSTQESKTYNTFQATNSIRISYQSLFLSRLSSLFFVLSQTSLSVVARAREPRTYREKLKHFSSPSHSLTAHCVYEMLFCFFFIRFLSALFHFSVSSVLQIVYVCRCCCCCQLSFFFTGIRLSVIFSFLWFHYISPLRCSFEGIYWTFFCHLPLAHSHALSLFHSCCCYCHRKTNLYVVFIISRSILAKITFKPTAFS